MSSTPLTNSITNTIDAEDDRGAEVGLQHEQRGERPEHHQHRLQRDPPVVDLVEPAGQQVGHEQQHGQLGELRRLDAGEAVAEPARGAVHVDAEARDHHQHHQQARARAPAAVV